MSIMYTAFNSVELHQVQFAHDAAPVIPLERNFSAGALELLLHSEQNLGKLEIEKTIDPETGATLYNFSSGTIEAGLLLAEVCMGGLGHAELVDSPVPLFNRPFIMVTTNSPVDALLRSQLAGYQLRSDDGYFGNVSGPGRVCILKDEIAQSLGPLEKTDQPIVFSIEGDRPTIEAIKKLAMKADVHPTLLHICYALPESLANCIQVVARSGETALEKMRLLKFDTTRVKWVGGYAPTCPPARDGDHAMAITNEAIMYGGSVTMNLEAGDAELREFVKGVPASARPDLYGKPYTEITARGKLPGGGFDFSLIADVFCPAQITLVNLDTAAEFSAGKFDKVQLDRAFGA